MKKPNFIIREANPNEFDEVGKLMVNVYSKLDGFPSKEEQPSYYEKLLNVGELTKNSKIKLLVASTLNNEIAGAVVYFSDMKYYGSGGTATSEKNAAGFRLLAVNFNARGNGIGKLLTNECIKIAGNEHQNQLIIHSTKAMQIAWKMYEKMGFKRSEDLDFMQEKLHVFGFRLLLNNNFNKK